MEALRHLLGMCGEHSHPSIINLGMIIPELYVVIKIFKYMFYGKTKTSIPEREYIV